MNKELQAELLSDLIDAAGYGIGYWAVEAHQDDQAQTYTITLDEDAAEEAGKPQVVLTYAQLRTAIRKVAQGSLVAPSLTRAANDFIFRPGQAEPDSDLADVVVQVAVFGEVVFG
jgi:hypothetical protein